MGNDIDAQQNYQRSVLDAINTVVQRRIDGLKLDKTVVGIIDKHIGMTAGYPLYQVKYEGGVFTATARDASESYARNTAVYVMIPQSDFSKEKFIIGRASSISSTSAESASISAAINNYVKLGPNLITNKSIYGLRSYHSSTEEIDDPNSYQHRFNFLYETNQENKTDVDVLQNLFKTYAADASNILLRADFRTNLDVVQQRSASGRYGLAVTLTFTNPNAGYGETQGEILDNLGGTIVGKAQRITTANGSYIIDVHTNEAKENNNIENEQGWIGNFDLDNISLKDWDKQLQLFFNSKDVDKNKIEIWQSDGVGLFDCYSQYIQTVYQTFCVNNAALQSSMTDNLVATYLNLLSDLKNTSPSLANIKQIYNDWRATSIGDLSDVDEIIYLTSDSMLGNPFAYTQWNNQYIIPSQQYDFSRFKEIKNIIFFKDGFKEDAEQEQLWPPSDAPKNGGKGWDIFCQNIQLFLLKDLDSEYQGFSLKVECAEGYDGVLKTLSSNEKTAFNAHVYRNQTEELTSNANIQYVWLKQNSQVINAKHADYYHYAGVGWKRLKNTNRFFFQTTGNENWAYKNLYKCIALYQTATETIPLSTNFIVYNDAVSTKVKLESDLGTAFTFSEGAPTITCLIEEAPLLGKTGEEAENYQEYGYSEESPLYKYQWSIADSNNSSIIFLTEAFADNTANVFKDNLISKIRMWYWDRENQKLEETRDPTKATRIQYPVSLSSSGFTVECIVQKNFSINDNVVSYYDVGNDSIEITNSKMASSSSYRVIIENGDQVFQYDEYGNAPTVTKLKDPLVIKPLRAKILGPTGLEFSGENANIEWIFNLDDTMIVPTEKLVLNPATQQEQLLKGDTCIFDITKLYNPSAQNNQITCHANFNNIDVYTDTKFYFGKVGSNGTNGTDMVSKISYDGNDNYFVLNSQPLTLYVQKGTPTEEEGETKSQAMFNVPDSNGDVNILKDTQDIIAKNMLNVHLYQKDEEIQSTNFALGYPKWNIAGNASGTTNNVGKYFKIEIEEENKKTKIIWNGSYNTDKPLFQNIRSEIKIKSDQTYYSFFSLPIIEYEKTDILVNDLLPMQRIAIDKQAYLVDIVYNADGRNPIYNHNQGLKLINLPENCTISWKACGNPKSCFKIIDSEQKDINENEDTEINQVYVLPDDVYSGSITNNYIEAKVKQNGVIIATVYAPINMTLNTFGLASLNAWDGNTVTIDEDGGYIMAPQIGAGEKDANNRFTGILMGKTETYTGGGDLEEEIGLFGYANGLQSIFLDSKTGNATFGLPDVETEYDDDGNLKSRKYKNTNRDSEDDYNEGRIELRPGGISKIGGWRLGRRGLYYIVDEEGELTEVGPGYQVDYIPEVNSGKLIKKDNNTSDKSPYSKHHEKDIRYTDSGILLHSGINPYISIKGRQLTKADISTSDIEYIRPNDSLELQLDPMAPTLFTIFRHNGTAWLDKELIEDTAEDGTTIQKIEEKEIYAKGSRTFLAGINGKGEFVANTVNSILVDDEKNVYTTQFSVNSFPAFDDFIIDNPNFVEGGNEPKKIEIPQHTGLRIKLGPYVLGQMFINNNGFDADIEENNKHDPTLYITGGSASSDDNEYARPLGLYGKRIKLFAKSGTTSIPHTYSDANLFLETNKFETNIGKSHFKLLRENYTDENDSTNLLMTGFDFKVNIGPEEEGYDVYIKVKINEDSSENIYIQGQSNPTIYINVEKDENDFYVEKDSWNNTIQYILKDPENTDSNYIVFDENNPNLICYKYNKNNSENFYYFTEYDLTHKYYKIGYKGKDYYIGEDSPRYKKITIQEIDSYEESYTDEKGTTINTSDPLNIDTYQIDVDGQYFKIPNNETNDDDETDIFIEIASVITGETYYYNSLTNEYIDTLEIGEKDNDDKYYYYNNQYIKLGSTEIDRISKYYLVQDYKKSDFKYIETTELDNYPELTYDIATMDANGYLYEYKENDPKLYIYRDGFKQIQAIKASQNSSISTNKYSLFAGEYYSEIVTNQSLNKKIIFSENKNGITLTNSSGGPISINSDSDIYNMKIGSNYHYQFGFEMDKEKDSEGKLINSIEEQEILGKFTINNSNKIGLFMTNTITNLTGNLKLSLETKHNFWGIVSEKGGPGGNAYSTNNPQIALIAGTDNINKITPTVNASEGTTSALILNSSGSGWSQQIRDKPLEKRLEYPVFAIKTGFSDIGIYPEIYTGGNIDLYREVFYIRMPQYNTNGLSIQGKIPNSDNGLMVNESGFFGGILWVNYDINTLHGNVNISEGNINIVQGSIYASNGGIIAKNLSASDKIYGNGKYVTNTADDVENKVASIPNIGGLGSSGTITMLTVTSNRGRPKFGTTSGTISIPSAKDIWNAISNKVETAISNYFNSHTFSLTSTKTISIVYDVAESTGIVSGSATVDGKTGQIAGTSTNGLGTVSKVNLSDIHLKIN